MSIKWAKTNIFFYCIFFYIGRSAHTLKQSKFKKEMVLTAVWSISLKSFCFDAVDVVNYIIFFFIRFSLFFFRSCVFHRYLIAGTDGTALNIEAIKKS